VTVLLWFGRGGESADLRRQAIRETRTAMRQPSVVLISWSSYDPTASTRLLAGRVDHHDGVDVCVRAGPVTVHVHVHHDV